MQQVVSLHPLTHVRPLPHFYALLKHQKVSFFSDYSRGSRSGTLVENELKTKFETNALSITIKLNRFDILENWSWCTENFFSRNEYNNKISLRARSHWCDRFLIKTIFTCNAYVSGHCFPYLSYPYFLYRWFF